MASANLQVKVPYDKKRTSFALLSKMDSKTCLAKLHSINELETSSQHCDYFPLQYSLYLQEFL